MVNQKTSVSAIIGLVLAIIALVLSAVPIINNFAFILALLGLILGIVGLMKVKKGKRTGKKLAIIAIVLSVLAGFIVLVSQQMYSNAIDEASKSIDESVGKATGEKTDDLLKDDVSVTLGEFTAVEGEFGMVNTTLPVTVTNKKSEAKSYTIHIEAVDAEGKRIADDYIYANGLGGNQTQDFKVFEYVDPEKLEQIKTAEFKIVTVSQM